MRKSAKRRPGSGIRLRAMEEGVDSTQDAPTAATTAAITAAATENSSAAAATATTASSAGPTATNSSTLEEKKKQEVEKGDDDTRPIAHSMDKLLQRLSKFLSRCQ